MISRYKRFLIALGIALVVAVLLSVGVTMAVKGRTSRPDNESYEGW